MPAKSSRATHEPSGATSCRGTKPKSGRLARCSARLDATLANLLESSLARQPFKGHMTRLPPRDSSSCQWQPRTHLDKSIDLLITAARALVWSQKEVPVTIPMSLCASPSLELNSGDPSGIRATMHTASCMRGSETVTSCSVFPTANLQTGLRLQRVI